MTNTQNKSSDDTTKGQGMSDEPKTGAQDSQHYSEINRMGGQPQGRQNNPGNFTSEEDKAGRAGQQSDEEK